MTEAKISDLVYNDRNPRTIKEVAFERLVESVKSFPEMLSLRPIVVDENNVVLGGNMRLRAAEAAGYDSVPVARATGLTEAQRDEFIIRDNASSGEWDWEALANEWDTGSLIDWGVDAPVEYDSVFDPNTEPQYSDDIETRESIEKRASELAAEMIKEIESRDMICPQCGHEYKVAAK